MGSPDFGNLRQLVNLLLAEPTCHVGNHTIYKSFFLTTPCFAALYIVILVTSLAATKFGAFIPSDRFVYVDELYNKSGVVRTEN
jgi:hypothetical protein